MAFTQRLSTGSSSSVSRNKTFTRKQNLAKKPIDSKTFGAEDLNANTISSLQTEVYNIYNGCLSRRSVSQLKINLRSGVGKMHFYQKITTDIFHHVEK